MVKLARMTKRVSRRRAARRLKQLVIATQPDETTCGPTCLHSVYNYYDQELPLDRLIRDVPRLRQGGTLAVWLACHALKQGFSATIYTYNLQIFDPTWFHPKPRDIKERLTQQQRLKKSPRLREATRGYLEFIDLGGELKFENLSRALIRRYLKQQVPIITGLSATYLYRTPREYGPKSQFDDLRGDPSGHFVVLCGYNQRKRSVLVADPFLPNPTRSHKYHVAIDQLIGAVLLGILTYDANLLIIEPK